MTRLPRNTKAPLTNQSVKIPTYPEKNTFAYNNVGIGDWNSTDMAYSGADFRVLIHVPVNPLYNPQRAAIDEIDDERTELAYQINNLEALEARYRQANDVARANDVAGRIRSLQNVIQGLNNISENIRKSKANVIPRTLTELQTISIQTHTDKQPVRSLGHSYPKGYTSGAKLVAGSMIFTIIKEHPLVRVIDTVNAGRNYDPLISDQIFKDPKQTSYDGFSTSATVDHLPPMNITIIGVNENGNAVNMNLYGVQFINDGIVLSIQDMLTEDTVSFVAQDIDIMRTLDTRGVLNIPAMSRAVTVSSFLTGPVAAARKARRGLPF